MKIRSKKTNRNTSYDFDDFLLKEFSKDKENYVHDKELSCNECFEIEDEANNKDDIKSFLIKFKANLLSDPKAIRSSVSGFILPSDGNYVLEKVKKSFFKSIDANHFILNSDESKLKNVVEQIHKDASLRIEFTKDQVNNYLLESYNQKDWDTLLQDSNKKKWRKHLGKCLKQSLVDTYGKIDAENIKEGIRLDRSGITKLTQEVKNFNAFSDNELTLVTRLIALK